MKGQVVHSLGFAGHSDSVASYKAPSHLLFQVEHKTTTKLRNYDMLRKTGPTPRVFIETELDLRCLNPISLHQKVHTFSTVFQRLNYLRKINYRKGGNVIILIIPNSGSSTGWMCFLGSCSIEHQNDHSGRKVNP